MKNEKGDEIVQVVNFKTVYVFDVAQTDGEPLPETPDAISSEKYPELETMLIDYARSLNIDVKIEDLTALGAQGSSSGGQITLDPLGRHQNPDPRNRPRADAPHQRRPPKKPRRNRTRSRSHRLCCRPRSGNQGPQIPELSRDLGRRWSQNP